MKRLFFVIAIAVLPYWAGAQTLRFSDDLKSDLEILNGHGVLFEFSSESQNAKYTIAEVKKDFEYIQSLLKIDLKKYRYTKTSGGYLTVDEWRSKTGLIKTVDQMEFAMPVDTFLSYQRVVEPHDNLNHITKPDSMHVKGVFEFHAYLIVLNNGKGISYVTEKGQGTRHYVIGSKKVDPIYESFVVEPDNLYQKMIAAIRKQVPTWPNR